MAITIKSKREIQLMTEAGIILQDVHRVLKDNIKIGMTTKALDELCEKTIRDKGCIPSFLNYHGYPASVCISINEEIVHGIPTQDRVFQDGDVVGLDIGVIHNGYHSDAARTYILGESTKEKDDLVRVTQECFFEGIKFAKEGYHLFDISAAIHNHAKNHGYGVVRELCGHGIGTELHEDPEVPNFKQLRKGVKLRAGMALAIEPMINQGTADVIWHDDGWTVSTADGKPSAHYENTIIITEGEPLILTSDGKTI